ncbi:predicted protein [Pyrenophora tritici-repentis Pt-1C-BFP]|uniref:Uncharacterized protein n=1 Tax=Pyrenophora tritici-repentis (strain Pt-1C-BFP) TaxID=426418 RepID=B2W8Z9_PYRTR|nr:uncharacterized protein PTRG_06457 [Pyrenophora tritici-repentis Pt-1C-BFP]EDU49377.1 predicted protein [Pyrenophora tritici-repentis Pt-1C-BFP]
MATGVIARSPLRCMILKTQEFNPSPNLCGPGIGFWIDARRPRGATPIQRPTHAVYTRTKSLIISTDVAIMVAI